MSESITGAVKYGKSLAFLTQSRIVITHDNGKEPRDWPQEVFSHVGTDNEFVRELVDEYPMLLDASSIYDPTRQQVKDAFMVLLAEGLLPAYERLREIRVTNGLPIPTLNRRQQFEDFTSALWRAYKTLLPKAAKLLGFDIGFLFQDDKDFETGVVHFNATYPNSNSFTDYLRLQRIEWQQGLKDFRNIFVEHRNADREQFASYYDLKTAENLFERVWQAIAFILPRFIAAHIRHIGLMLEEIPPTERDPVHRRRFRWVAANRQGTAT